MLVKNSCRLLQSIWRRPAQWLVPRSAYYSTETDPAQPIGRAKAKAKRTPLYELHTEMDGRMVDFAGHLLPVQYPDGIVAEHKHCRESAGLFDVSHMQQLRVCGINRDQLISYLTVADVESLNPGQACLSLFLNTQGCIMDDLIVSRCREPHYYLVTNAGTSAKIRAHLDHWVAKFQARALDIRLEYMDSALMALQGPRAAEVLSRGVADFPIASLAFMHGRYAKLFGVPGCRVTRCGYTGMDGFELSVPKEGAADVARALLDAVPGAVKPIGLGARDSLRLEAGLCLYGNDIDETRTPAEAGLLWTVTKRRRREAERLGGEAFIGGQTLAGKQSPECRRVGLIGLEGPPARQGAAVYPESANQEKPQEAVGLVTSGCMSPSLGQPIAMAYLARSHAAVGTPVRLEIRGKRYRGTVSKMPFLPATYYTGGSGDASE